MRIFLFFFFNLFIHFIAISQSITGIITDSDTNKKVTFAQILIKKDSITNRIEQYSLATEGNFIIHLNPDLKNGILIIQSMNYKRKTIPFSVNVNDDLQLTITLTKKPPHEIEEVVIKADPERTYKKKDTTVYVVSQFTDGTERKVEDVLKNMPGIEVNETSGEIKYLGKSVETVLLEGDNLFGQNYTIGTKNINVEAITEVEAIDNYSENDLLKDIEDSDKVALNLKLKENYFDLSADVELGAGIMDNELSRLVDGTVLGIQKKLKSFTVLEHNNIGESKSPRNYFTYAPNFEQLSEQKLISEKVIPETSFSSLLGQSNSRFNNEYFGSINGLYKFNNRFSAKVNAHAITDRLTNYRSNTTMYQLPDGSNFETSDEIDFSKNPILYRGDIELLLKTGENSSLKINSRLSDEDIDTEREIIQNNELNILSNLNSRQLVNKNEAQFTKRLDNNNALVLSTRYVESESPQRFIISKENNQELIQESEFLKSYFAPEAQWIGSKNNFYYTTSLGFIKETMPYSSSNTAGSINNNEFSTKQYYAQSNLSWEIGQFTIQPNVKLTHFNQQNDGLNQTERKDVFIDPKVQFRVKLHNNSSFTGTAGRNRSPFNEKYLFENRVFIDERTSIQYNGDLQIIDQRFFGVNYKLQDVRNNFTVLTGIQFSQNLGNYYPQQEINTNSIASNFIYLPNKTSGFTSTINLDKYVHSLVSRFKLNGNYSQQQYFNFINNSNLRENTAKILGTNLFYKSAFDGLFNFENDFNYTSFQSETLQIESQFSNHTISNQLKVISYLRDDIRFFTDYTFFKPNQNSKNSYHFINATLNYSPKNKDWNAALLLYNILNERNYESVTTSDISFTKNQSELLSRRCLATISYSF